jgi:hypothetical protein
VVLVIITFVCVRKWYNETDNESEESKKETGRRERLAAF